MKDIYFYEYFYGAKLYSCGSEVVKTARKWSTRNSVLSADAQFAEESCSQSF